MPSLSFPPMSAVLATWWGLILSGELFRELGDSLWRMFAGYFIGVSLGVLLGLLMGYVRFFYNLLEPITEVLRPIPSPAYLPIVILFLGIDDEMKIFMIAFASLFPVLINTYSGVRSVDPIQLQTARTFGVSGRKLVWQIVLPAASPYIFTGMRISLAVALIVMVISEMVAASSGIGYFILSAQRGFKIREMFAGVLTLGGGRLSPQPPVRRHRESRAGLALRLHPAAAQLTRAAPSLTLPRMRGRVREGVRRSAARTRPRRWRWRRRAVRRNGWETAARAHRAQCSSRRRRVARASSGSSQKPEFQCGA